ncbi:MAG: hypothetical protein Ta2D_07940 [Rickettsiales bacterium]|nr:MAG: hypothetical protein Ta2D_07940 [Rickettsiales bacterium]
MKISKEVMLESYKEIVATQKPLDDEDEKNFNFWDKLTLNDIKEETEQDLKDEEQFLKEFKNAQTEYKNAQNKTFSVIIQNTLVEKIEKKTSNIQSLINNLLTQYVEGKINLSS